MKRLCLLFLLLGPLDAGAQDLPVPPEVRPPTLEMRWNWFRDVPQLDADLFKLHAGFPELTDLEEIGTSSEGRTMRVLTVRSLKRGPVSGRPAMWVDGNVHGNEVQGSDACLYLAWYLLENYGKVDRITELVDRVSFYILPTVNPDGRAWWFNAPNTASSSRSGKSPRDNDFDGLLDEDGPNDLDGDGELLQMRIRDPEGRWRVSAKDPRLMERVGPGEKGEWTLLGQEGIDDDGDGRINEDGPGGYDMNRNWPSFWMPDFIQYGAGEYPFSYPEPRAVGDFILARDNIAAVQSFHNAGGMILRGPGVETFGSYPSGDVRVYDRLGADGEAMLPFYRYMVIWKDLYSVYGGFVTWTYEHLGIISFTNELWSQKRLYQSDGPVNSDQRMKFNDLLRSGIDYADWKPFDHPQYGMVELGGWRKMTSRVPPSFLIEEECHRNALFCIKHAEEMPEIAWLEERVVKTPDGLWQVDVSIENKRWIPTVTELARKNRIGEPDLLACTGDRLDVVLAARVDRRLPEQLRLLKPGEPVAGARVAHRSDGSFEVLDFSGVGHDQPWRVRLWVRAEEGAILSLQYRSQKGGSISCEIELSTSEE